jgi:folate-dependent phosphoribosylglycinamide formyltransferase PurN
VEDNDTADTLAQRVQIEEKLLLPQVIGELKKNIKETTK